MTLLATAAVCAQFQCSQLSTLIPQISLLIFAIICMEWHLRKEASANNGISNNGAPH